LNALPSTSNTNKTEEEEEEEEEEETATEPPAPANANALVAAVLPSATVPAPAVAAAPTAPAQYANLAYRNEAFELSECKGGNSSESLKDVLQEMSLKGMVNEDSLNSSSCYPERWHRHKQILIHCLELVAFAGDKNYIRILASERGDGTDKAAVRSAAFNLEMADHGKLLEFEGSTLVLDSMAPRPKATYITGLAKRILEYKKRIWKAMGKVGKQSDAPLMELNEVGDKEREQQYGTPRNHRNVMSYFQ
jgi:hypothetical protein